MSSQTVLVPDLPCFGRYRAIAALGTGAMGAVYVAHDEQLGRRVAVKTIRASRDDAGIRRRFVQEARAIGALVHPNIVAIYDSGIDGDVPYLVMELAPGGSLRERLDRALLPPHVVRSIGIQIGHALAAAHAARILHRDVKPANILATADGMWKLADFGIARLPGSKLTITGQFLGSPSYAAPEALLAGVSSEATDVYSLGATLYEALVGEPPRGHRSADSLLAGIRRPPAPLRDRLTVPPSLEAAIMAALAVDPADRPTAADFARQLAQGTPRPRAAARVVDLAATVIDQPRRPRYGRAAIVAAIALLLLLAGITSGGSQTRWERAAVQTQGAAR